MFDYVGDDVLNKLLHYSSSKDYAVKYKEVIEELEFRNIKPHLALIPPLLMIIHDMQPRNETLELEESKEKIETLNVRID